MRSTGNKRVLFSICEENAIGELSDDQRTSGDKGKITADIVCVQERLGKDGFDTEGATTVFSAEALRTELNRRGNADIIFIGPFGSIVQTLRNHHPRFVTVLSAGPLHFETESETS